MKKGKVKDATRLLSDDSKGTPLPLDLAVNTDDGGKTVRDVLHKKFPAEDHWWKLHSKWMNQNNTLTPSFLRASLVL